MKGEGSDLVRLDLQDTYIHAVQNWVNQSRFFFNVPSKNMERSESYILNRGNYQYYKGGDIAHKGGDVAHKGGDIAHRVAT